MTPCDNSAAEKLVGFGQPVRGWPAPDGRRRDFAPGELARLSTSQYWQLKTLHPAAVYDMTPGGRG